MAVKEEEIPTIEKNVEIGLCGQKNVEYFKLQNTSRVTKTYQIVGKRTSQGSESRLLIQPHKMIVESGKIAKFTLVYLPYLENVVDNYYYSVLELSKTVTHLNIHAKSVGPSVRVSTSHIIFIQCRGICQWTKIVEFLNTSECPTRYCFDVDEDFQNFNVSSRTGLLQPGVKLQLKFTFNPEKPGVYFKRMFCLLQFHSPLIFYLVGVCKPKLTLDPKAVVFNYYQKELRTGIDYETYFGNFNQRLHLEAAKPFQVSTTPTNKGIYVNKQVAEEAERSKRVTSVAPTQYSEYEIGREDTDVDVALIIPYVDVCSWPMVMKATTLMNLSKIQRYSFQWNKDPKGHFRIDPCSGIIEPGERVEFAVYFTPSIPDILYHVDFDVTVLPWKIETMEPTMTINLPSTHNLRVIGNSFPEGSCLWISQCKVIPKILHLPTCEPKQTVYGTFMVERSGHLPVNFVVILPKKSNYFIEPQMGYLSGDFQLFVVKFKAKRSGFYKAEVKLQYDNFGTCFDTFNVATLVETPKLVFGEKNSHVFQTTFPGCRVFNKVTIKNPTSLHLRYEFEVPENITWVDILNPTGSFEPMGLGEIEIAFQPKTPDQYKAHLPFITTGLYGVPKKFLFQVSGSCEFGYLVATPNSYDFGDCICGNDQSLKIHLYNFSSVVLNFLLEISDQTSSVTNIEGNTSITPTRGTMAAKGFMELDVRVTPLDKRLYHFVIKSSILVEDSEEAFSCEDPKIIFSFTFKGVFPTFQIIDLNLNGGGPLFSPHWIWKMLAIDELNRALNSLAPETQIDLKFPEASIGSQSICIALLIEANKYGPTSWRIKKKLLCNCSEATEENCHHSKSLAFSPTEFQLKPKERRVLELTISYLTHENCTIQCFFLTPYGKKIILNSRVKALSKDDKALCSAYLHSVFRLKPVYIGNPMPPFQMFWLYNNTHYLTTYDVQKTTSENSNAIECVNNTGILLPFSNAPLLFLFKPLEIKPYTIKFNFCADGFHFTPIFLEGEGIAAPFVNQDLETTVPEHPILYNANVSLECSVNFINLGFCGIFSKIRRLFYLRNRSETHAWSFRWHNFRAEKLFSVEVVPEKGVLEPGAEVPVTLVFQSFNRTTSISYSVPCKVINYTKFKAYNSAVDYEVAVMKNCGDYFVITEKGITTEVPVVPIPEKPNSNYLFLNVFAKIVSPVNADYKLSIEEELILRAGGEIECKEVHSNLSFDLPILSFAQNFLEKLLWKTLSRDMFSEKLMRLKDESKCNYFEMLPRSKKETENIYNGRIFGTPSKSYVQEYLENILHSILMKNSHR